VACMVRMAPPAASARTGYPLCANNSEGTRADADEENRSMIKGDCKC
jgi:hypothetical protein